MEEYKYNTKLKTIKPNWQGNKLIDGEYTNGEGLDSRFSLWDVLKWKLSSKSYKNGRKDSDYQIEVIKDNSFLKTNDDVIVWLGHATFYIRINGISIITDPIFNAMPFVKRWAEFPINPNELTDIDYVLLSHGHRDHFDKKSIILLANNNPNMEVLLPMDLGDWFLKKRIKHQQAVWFQVYKTKSEVEITFMPAMHWNRRDGNDFNTALWGSFIINTSNKTILFAGDTAYGEHFKEIQEFFPKIDYSLLPIAAYRPDYIMKQSHMSPWEAIQAFKDIDNGVMIPMHYGTFQLADEYFGEPEEVMREKSEELNIEILPIGFVKLLE